MAFLVGLLSKYLLLPLISGLFALLANRVQSYMEQREAERKIAERNRAIKDKLKAAKTPEEKDAAIIDTIDSL